MSNVSNLEQQLASLQINHGDDATKLVKPVKKVGPAVPPKPKKSQPQVNLILQIVTLFQLTLLFVYHHTNIIFYAHASLNGDATQW